MFDTVVLTHKGGRETDFKLKNLSEWDDVRSGGIITKYKKNIHLNTKRGKHNGSLFIGYDNVIGSMKISVALPKLVYGSSLYEIQPEDEDKVKESIYNITNDWIDFDIDKTKVSPLLVEMYVFLVLCYNTAASYIVPFTQIL